jgi:hypothetical protein
MSCNCTACVGNNSYRVIYIPFYDSSAGMAYSSFNSRAYRMPEEMFNVERNLTLLTVVRPFPRLSATLAIHPAPPRARFWKTLIPSENELVKPCLRQVGKTLMGTVRNHQPHSRLRTYHVQRPRSETPGQSGLNGVPVLISFPSTLLVTQSSMLLSPSSFPSQPELRASFVFLAMAVAQ